LRRRGRQARAARPVDVVDGRDPGGAELGRRQRGRRRLHRGRAAAARRQERTKELPQPRRHADCAASCRPGCGPVQQAAAQNRGRSQGAPRRVAGSTGAPEPDHLTRALTSFADLRLVEPLQRALAALGFTVPTTIQRRALPPLLQGRDVFAVAGAGSGKSSAATLALLQVLTGRPLRADSKETRALLLAPTREQAEQLGLLLEGHGRYLRVRHLVAADGTSWNHSAKELRAGVEILVATPKRLLELRRQRALSLRSVEIVVLDDADRMLEQGLLLELDKLLFELPEQRQAALLAS